MNWIELSNFMLNTEQRIIAFRHIKIITTAQF